MRPCRPALVALGLLLLAGCRDREVQAYRVPKERLPTPAPADAGTAASAPLEWTAPDHWQENPAAGFRRGSFTVRGVDGAEADLSIIAFPGGAGGLLENLNRWRGQLDLPPFSDDEASASIEHVDGRDGLHFDVVDFAGTTDGTPARIIGAVLEHGGETWFFKLMGPDATVAAERPAFAAFLQTVRPATQ